MLEGVELILACISSPAKLFSEQMTTRVHSIQFLISTNNVYLSGHEIGRHLCLYLDKIYRIFSHEKISLSRRPTCLLIIIQITRAVSKAAPMLVKLGKQTGLRNAPLNCCGDESVRQCVILDPDKSEHLTVSSTKLQSKV